MTVEEIKDKYSMNDILERLNISVKKGFCSCPLHKEKTASMKVYKDGFYCFGCGKGGDIIKFVEYYHDLGFKDACEWISGESLSKMGRYALEAEKRKRRYIAERHKQLKEKLVNLQLAKHWHIYQTSEPFSDEWCKAYNEWQKGVYAQEEMLKELGQ